MFDAGAGPLLRQQHDVGFGDDLDLVAQRRAGLDGLAKQRFAAVVAVNVGVVEGGDALGQAGVDACQIGLDAGVVMRFMCVDFCDKVQRRTPLPSGVAGVEAGTRP